MEKEYFSVTEISEMTGKSIQSIYKRIRNNKDLIQPFVEKDNNGNFIIKKDVLSKVYGINNKNICNDKKFSGLVEFSNNNTEEETEQQESIVINELREQINLLKEQVETQKDINSTKDKLIFELNERLKENQIIIEQQQKLTLTDKQHIAFLEEQYNKRKKPFLLRLFSGKDKENYNEES